MRGSPASSEARTDASPIDTNQLALVFDLDFVLHLLDTRCIDFDDLIHFGTPVVAVKAFDKELVHF